MNIELLKKIIKDLIECNKQIVENHVGGHYEEYISKSHFEGKIEAFETILGYLKDE